MVAKAYAEHVGLGGTLLTVRAGDAMAPRVEHILEHGEAPAMAATAAPVVAAPVARAAAPAVNAAADKIELVKENLVVGKREVEQGATRVTTRVVETPVEEQVRLRRNRPACTAAIRLRRR